jgi:hypothetical protein
MAIYEVLNRRLIETLWKGLSRADQLGQHRICAAPEALRQRKLAARLVELATLESDQRRSIVPSGVVRIVRDHLRRGLLRERPVAGIACHARNRFQREQRPDPVVGPGQRPYPGCQPLQHGAAFALTRPQKQSALQLFERGRAACAS